MEKITEGLERRQRERKTRLDNLQEIKNREVSANEGIDYFDSVFDEKVREIQNNLTNLEAGDSNLPTTFSKIGQSLQDLQKFLSSSTFFLNDRKVQKCQEVLNGLSTRVEERKAALVPKRKFGFKNKPREAPKPPAPDSVDAPKSSPATHFDYTVSGRTREVISFSPADSDDKDITIADISHCLVRIEGHPGSLHLKNASDCLVLSGPVARSVFGDKCERSVFAIACQQLRLHNSSQCDIYLHVTSRGIIEDSRDIRVAPYSFEYGGIAAHFEASGLPLDRNNWHDLADFNWLSTEQSSPNWSVLPESERVADWEGKEGEFRGSIA